MTKRAIICGGSIGGLFAATALLKAGWHVDIYERTKVELSGRGAGIVTHDKLNNALSAVGADLTDLGVQVHDRVAFHKDGGRVATLPYPQIVTSWDRIHQMLQRLVPEGAYHLGKHITGYTQTTDDVTALFSDGTARTADLLIGADGFRSAIRGQMLPDIKPQYAGYVVWRALAHERDLPSDVHNAIFPNFAFFTPSQSQIIGYPIAGPNNDLSEGNRRYNFVWYASPDLNPPTFGSRCSPTGYAKACESDFTSRVYQNSKQFRTPLLHPNLRSSFPSYARWSCRTFR